MQEKTARTTAKLGGVLLLISLGVNALFIWNNKYEIPDENFYPHELRDSYFVRSHASGQIFTIEHLGHRYTAKCRDTLVWPDGIYAPGRPMSDGCIYMPTLVGKSIAGGLMRKEGDALVYQPWEQTDTVQTADILTIIDDRAK